MGDTKPPQSAYSGERIEITGPHSLRGTTATAEAEKSEKPTAPGEVTESAGKDEAAQNVVTASPRNAPAGHGSLANSSPLNARSGAYSVTTDFLEFLKRTRYVWLGLGGAAIALMMVVTMMKGASERARIATAKRHDEAATTVTPENLLARCGPAAEDVTKQMFPVLLRTMSYQPRENEKVVFEFSRTAEEKSDWVFLSMKDQSGTRSYDTPEEKIAALPCLDSKK